MNNKNEQAKRKAGAQVERPARKASDPDYRRVHRNAALPYPCNPGIDRIFARRPSMRHLPPSLF